MKNNNYKVKVKNAREFDQVMNKYSKINPETFIPGFTVEEKNRTHSMYLYSLRMSVMYEGKGVEDYFHNHKNEEISLKEYVDKEKKTLL